MRLPGQDRQCFEPCVQLLERPAEVAERVPQAPQRAAQASPLDVERFDDTGRSIDDAEVELLAGVDSDQGEPLVEDRLPAGIRSGAPSPSSTHDPLSARPRWNLSARLS